MGAFSDASKKRRAQQASLSGLALTRVAGEHHFPGQASALPRTAHWLGARVAGTIRHMISVPIEVANENLVCGTWQSALIYVFTGTVTLQTLTLIDAVHDRLAERFPRRTVAISISAANLKLPDAETRSFGQKLIAKRPADAVVSAVVLEGGGIWAAGARAAVSTMFLIARTERQNKVFSSFELAANWAAPLADPVMRADDLRQAIQLVRDKATTQSDR